MPVSLLCYHPIDHEALCQPLRISIANEHAVSTTNIYRDSVLEIVGARYLIDLIPIAMGDVFIIEDMDWLSQFGVLIGYDQHLVMVPDPSEGVLTI